MPVSPHSGCARRPVVATMHRMTAPKEIVEKVMNLGKLALSKENGESTEEARNAAVKALALMKENDLIVMPRADVERMVAGQKELADVQAKANKNLLMGLAVGYFGGKGGLKF